MMGKGGEQKRGPASISSNSRYVGLAHVTTSQGQFSQSYQSATLDSAQNSPITFGLGGAYIFQKYPGYSLSGSAYFSTLSLASINESSRLGIASDSVDVPTEIGANLYLQKNINSQFSYYGGFDLEKFSTLNFIEVATQSDDELKVIDQSMIFLTAGLGYNTKIILPTSFKISLSPVISSKTELSGYKYILYANQKITKKIWYHVFYKKHILADEVRNEEVSIARIGLGVGMAF